MQQGVPHQAHTSDLFYYCCTLRNKSTLEELAGKIQPKTKLEEKCYHVMKPVRCKREIITNRGNKTTGGSSSPINNLGTSVQWRVFCTLGDTICTVGATIKTVGDI